MPPERMPLICGVLCGVIALLCTYADAKTESAAARISSGCVVCHTDRDMLTHTLNSSVKKISALIEGPG